jgi:hypothetical protein
MNKEELKWFEKGYDEACWGYPVLDFVWGGNIDYPKEYQQLYRNGQIKSYEDGKSERPWFHRDYKSIV